MSPKLDAAAQDSRREKVAAWCRQVGLDPGFRSLTWSAWEWITTGDRGRPETK